MDLGFDLKGFVDEEDPELPEYRNFFNKKTGVSFVARSGLVTTIYYTPTEAEKIKYACETKGINNLTRIFIKTT